MIIEVLPPDRVGPVVLGMSVDEAEAALQSLDGYQGAGSSQVPVRGQANYTNGMSVHAYLDSERLVNAIEVFRPHRDVSVVLGGVDVFRTPASDVVERLRGVAEIEEEEGGTTIVAPSLLVSLWRPFVASDEADEQGFYFQSVLLARPGYYD